MMEIKQYNEIPAVYAIGDIHGEFKGLKHWLKTYGLTNAGVICCGDVGLGFDGLAKTKIDLQPLEKYCSENNVHCFFIRGNHDNPAWYKEDKLGFEHIHPVKDYTILSFAKMNVLCIGGAVSIDRKLRQEAFKEDIYNNMRKKHYTSYEIAKAHTKQYWWEDEAVVYNENALNDIAGNKIKIDVVCSHASPSFCYPLTSSRLQDWCAVDETLENDVKEDRENLTKVFTFLKEHNNKPQKWFYGHYHEYNTDVNEGCTFILLDMARQSKRKNSPPGQLIYAMEVLLEGKCK